MELAYQINNVKSVVNPTDAYKTLPFAYKNMMDYRTSNYPIFSSNSEWEIHSQKMVQSQYFDKRWRIYFAKYLNNHGEMYAIETNNPMDNWEIIKDGNNAPLEIITRTEDWEDSEYGIGGLNVVEFRETYNGVTYNFLGFYTYKDNEGYYQSAVARSIDGLTWTAKERLVLDDTMTNNFSKGYISCAFYDYVNGKLYAAFHLKRKSTSTTSGGISVFAESVDGINWSFLSAVRPVNMLSKSGEDSIFNDVCRIGDLFVGVCARYDYGEGVPNANNKNIVIHYSLDGKTWMSDNTPMLQPSRNAIRDVSMNITNNSIYFTWQDGIYQICLSRIETSFNPPIDRYLGGVSAMSTVSTSNSYITGDYKADIYISGTAEQSGQAVFLIYNVLTDNQRVQFEEVEIKRQDIEIKDSGEFLYVVSDVYLPHLSNLKVWNKTSGEISDIKIQIQKLCL